jgi:hypothetical protein
MWTIAMLHWSVLSGALPLSLLLVPVCSSVIRGFSWAQNPRLAPVRNSDIVFSCVTPDLAMVVRGDLQHFLFRQNMVNVDHSLFRSLLYSPCQLGQHLLQWRQSLPRFSEDQGEAPWDCRNYRRSKGPNEDWPFL